MCDTFAIGSAGTQSGDWIFGKNSDREPDEAQIVVSIPRKDYDQSESLKCTYIEIPQVKSTNALVISKPFWIWGAEMGVNEKGVVIGNEALFTRIKPEMSPGLIGMDLLRLGLERSDTAQGAADTIIDLLQQYGQGGSCGYMDKAFQYMNSYLIMDPRGIIVLETMGRDYVLNVFADYAAISNGITAQETWDRSSFAPGTNIKAFTDPVITRFAGSEARMQQNLQRLSQRKGSFSLRDAFSMLRAHKDRLPFVGFNQDVCMHAADPLIRKSQTTGSMVVALNDSGGFRIFVTAGSCPCMTSFKPLVPLDPPESVDNAGPGYSVESYWWRHEAFHINAALRYTGVHDAVAEEICRQEEKYCFDIPSYSWATRDASLCSLSHEAFHGARMTETKWIQEMKGIKKDFHLIHNAYWQRIARRRGVPIV
jgi:secernin